MECVHAHGVARRLDSLPAATRGLKHTQLGLELRRVAAKRLERLAHLLRVVSVAASRQVFETRKRGK
jgi:hypothetical protein